MIKWVAALVGYMFFRFPGALMGFFVGSMLGKVKINDFKNFQKKPSPQPSASPGDFELNLLSLSSIVIKADGSASKTELDYVRQYFVSAYGKDRANAIFRTFNDVVKNRVVSAQRICTYLVHHTKYASRLQIIHFLFGIAQADGSISDAETLKIQEISRFMEIHFKDFESIKAMFFQSADNAYKILKIKKTATDDEVKKAFRNMAKKYHPDKVQHMDEAYIKGAEEKFKKVQKAYEHIQKERGL